MGSAEPPVPPVPRRSAPPRRSVPPSGDELLVGATIQTHDLSGGPPAGDTGHSGALAPAQPSPPGLSGEWQRLRVYGGGALLLLCFVLFGWQAWRGREPAPVTVQSLAADNGGDIKVHVAGAVAQPGVYQLTQGDRVEDAIRAAGGLSPDADQSGLNLAQRVRDEQRLDIPFAPQPAAPAALATAPEVGGDAGADAPPPSDGAPPDAGAAPREAPPDTLPQAAAPPPEMATARPTVRPAPTARPPATPQSERPERPPPAPRPTDRADGKVNVNTATAAQLESLPGIGEVSAQKIITYREANGPITSLEQLRQAGIAEGLLRRAADHLAFE